MNLLDAFGRSVYPASVPVFNSQLSQALYDAAKNRSAFGWLDHQVLGQDGRPAGRGFVVTFTRYENLSW